MATCTEFRHSLLHHQHSPLHQQQLLLSPLLRKKHPCTCLLTDSLRSSSLFMLHWPQNVKLSKEIIWFKRIWFLHVCSLVSPYFSLVFQASLVAPSSSSEAVLDMEQVTLQEASLPPPIQRVMDPGQARMCFFFLCLLLSVPSWFNLSSIF